MENENLKDLYNEYHFYSIWSWSHLLFGFMFFILMHKYSKLSSLHIIIILLIVHTIYEYKDYYGTYIIYDNDIKKIHNAHLYLKDKTTKMLNALGVEPNGVFHMPPQSLKNSVGDTLFFMVGLYIAFLLKDYINHTIQKLIVYFSIIYWLEVVVSYIYVLDLGLFNKKFVDKHF